MTTLTFRTATLDDFKSLAKLVNEFDKFLSIEHGNPTITAKELARSRRYVKKYLTDSNCAYLTASKSNKMVGYSFLSNDKKKPTVGFINELFVADSERKKGVAKQIVEQSIIWFQHRNIKTVQLTVNRQNKNAISVYESMKFQHQETDYIDMTFEIN